MIDNENQAEVKCSACQRSVQYGEDCTQVQHGVCGRNGMVPIGQAFTFCSDECHEGYFNSEDSVEQERQP